MPKTTTLPPAPVSAALAATIAVTALLALAPGALFAAEPLTMKWSVDGVERQALVFPPAAEAVEAGTPSPARMSPRVPLVFAFHGHGNSMQEAARTMDLQSLWPQALVVYPQGLHTPAARVDPFGFRAGFQLEAGSQGDRDVKFLDAMLATLRARYAVDDRRIYSTGFSNGGFFSYILWAERPGVFAAFASCSGRIGDGVRLAVPKPILQVTGRRDHIVPTEAQLATIATVRALDGATGDGTACGVGCTSYPSTLGAPVVTILHAGGHLYPSGTSAEIVKFFQANALPR